MRVDYLTAENANRISNRLKGQYLLVWLIGITTGLRVSDILKLTVHQTTHKKAYITEQKTKKKRVVYIRRNIRLKCLNYAKRNNLKDWQPIFTVSRQSVWRAIKKAAGQENIPTNIGAHTMRKSYSVAYINKGNSIHELQKRLNHTHISDTIGYITSNKMLGLDEKGKQKQKKGAKKKK